MVRILLHIFLYKREYNFPLKRLLKYNISLYLPLPLLIPLPLLLSLISNVRGETGGDERDKKAGSLYVALDIVRSMEHFRLVWICHLLVSGGIRH